MTHRFPIKEIAAQAGLGSATVDRVLNDRANVSPQTHARVQKALKELKSQETLLSANGRRLFFDFIIEAPKRFSNEIKKVVEKATPEIGNAVCRSRFTTSEFMSDDDLVAVLKRIKIRGSHGVCIKTRNTPRIRDAVNAISKTGIPVITLVTDLNGTDRIAYVGMDNIGAGETAAYLIEQTLGNQHKTIITTQSNEHFLGEASRERAFEAKIKSNTPKINIIKIKGGGGVERPTKNLVYDAIQNIDYVDGVYSMGGGNKSILSALDDLNLNPKIFIAHDLDKDNQELLIEKKITFILNHNLTHDLKHVFYKFLSSMGLYPPQPDFIVSNIDLITPLNIPKN